MAKPKLVRPWQRERAGRYASADARFAIEQESAERWFLTDAEQQDELGQPRVLGPFASLGAAKSEAERLRARGSRRRGPTHWPCPALTDT